MSAGSQEGFSSLMNQKAASLGMRNSNFINPNGLPQPGQYSTARDMAIAARAAYRSPLIRSFTATKGFTFRFNDGRTRFIENTNKLLKTVPYCDGLKTGTTNAAGRCLVCQRFAQRPLRHRGRLEIEHAERLEGLQQTAGLGTRTSGFRILMPASPAESLRQLAAEGLLRGLRPLDSPAGPQVIRDGQDALELRFQRLSRPRPASGNRSGIHRRRPEIWRRFRRIPARLRNAAAAPAVGRWPSPRQNKRKPRSPFPPASPPRSA